MHESNRYYGHDAILRAYCGVHPRRQIAGVVQHGWSPVEWVDSRRSGLSHLPFFVWNGRVRDETVAAGTARVTTIGSPFAYLLELIEPTSPAGRDDVLVLPYHGLADGDETETVGGFLREVAEREPRDRVTVYLHANEMADPTIRILCERLGLRVDSFWRSRASMHDPYLLIRQIAAYSRASKVIANGICTPLWYAACLGAEPSVYGPGTLHPRVPTRAADIGQRTRDRWPFVFADERDFDPDAARDAARVEVGIDAVLAPESLATTLGFGSLPKQFLARAVDGVSDVRRRVRSAGS